jgi:phosphoribulokinase
MKTIGQQIKWDFKTNGNLEIRDTNGRQLYMEYSNGDWAKYEMDSQGKVIYAETSGGYWEKRELDSQGNVIYYENSNGQIVDSRTPEIIEHNGRKYQLIK